MFLPVAIGMKQHQVPPWVMLVVAIPRMQVHLLVDWDHLPTARAEPVLVAQEWSSTRRRRPQRQRAVAVLEVRLPGRVEGISRALDLERARRCDRFPHPEQLLASSRVSEAPRFSRTMRKVAVSDPAPGLGRVAALSPALHSPPDKVIELGEGLSANHMALLVRPTPEHGGEGLEELCRGGTPGLLTEGPDLSREGLEASRARSNLPRGGLVVGPLGFAHGLPSEVTALREGGKDRLLRREPPASGC